MGRKRARFGLSTFTTIPLVEDSTVGLVLPEWGQGPHSLHRRTEQVDMEVIRALLEGTHLREDPSAERFSGAEAPENELLLALRRGR